MKNQALFSSKDKSKKLKCRLLQFLFGTKNRPPFGYSFGSISSMTTVLLVCPLSENARHSWVKKKQFLKAIF